MKHVQHRDRQTRLHPWCVSVLLCAQPRGRRAVRRVFFLKASRGVSLMESEPWPRRATALALLLLTWSSGSLCHGLTVDPPEELKISDPGHLGRLDITWRPPANLADAPGCPPRYQLDYFDANLDDWQAIQTPRRSYSAQFDLMKDVRVRLYTLLSGPCTNGTMIKSTRYTEVIQKPSSTGVSVQDVTCVFHNMEHMECNWGRNPKMPANSKLHLYFWHKGLEHAEECPKYIISGGVRSGCDFTGKSLPDFTDINFCVNGSSREGPLKPTFISLQTQNQVKPGRTDQLYLHAGPDSQLEIQWERPTEKLPGDCLEWEVEHTRQGPDERTTAQQILTKDMSLTLAPVQENEQHCFRVRSKVHKYCADGGFWSDWSRPTCHPAVFQKKDVVPEPDWDVVLICAYAAVALIIVPTLLLGVWAVIRATKSGQEKEPDSLRTTLMAKNSVLTVMGV